MAENDWGIHRLGHIRPMRSRLRGEVRWRLYGIVREMGRGDLMVVKETIGRYPLHPGAWSARGACVDVARADTVFRSQPCPSNLTFLSLLVILAGAFGYVATDSAFTLTAYSWAFAYLITITTEMVYIKHMVMSLGLNTWGFVFYNNLLSLMMAPFFSFVTGENVEIIAAVRSGGLFDPAAFYAVSLSCLFGLLISFFGFAARRAVSATAFTVTGVVNKFLTVAINVLIWDKHASPIGLVCLFFTIVGGILYQQSVTGLGSAPAQPKQLDTESNKGGGEDDDDGDLTGESDGLIKATSI